MRSGGVLQSLAGMLVGSLGGATSDWLGLGSGWNAAFFFSRTISFWICSASVDTRRSSSSRWGAERCSSSPLVSYCPRGEDAGCGKACGMAIDLLARLNVSWACRSECQLGT